jgi:hypothetical protein
MPGVYKLLLDEDMTIATGNDSEEMVFHITHAGMAPVTRSIELYRRSVTSGYTLTVEADGDLTKVNTLDGHTAQTGDCYVICADIQSVINGAHGLISIQDDIDLILEDTGTTLDALIKGVPTNAELTTALATSWTTALTESYAVAGDPPTPAQALFLIMQAFTEFGIVDKTITVKQLNRSTPAATYTLDHGTTPTSRTRAT